MFYHVCVTGVAEDWEVSVDGLLASILRLFLARVPSTLRRRRRKVLETKSL